MAHIRSIILGTMFIHNRQQFHSHPLAISSGTGAPRTPALNVGGQSGVSKGVQHHCLAVIHQHL
jgi:hypothetical protein